MPIISVIIPAYNAEKTIQETVQSVLNQTFTDFELLIVDDGSQDATLDIIKRISDPRIQVSSYPNAGANISRNRGLAQAAGEYVSFLDADDLWTPDKLEAQLNALQTNTQAAVAYSWTDCIDESGQFSRHGGSVTVNGNVLAELLIINFLSNGSNALIRKQAIAELGGFDESLSACQDWDMWLRLAAKYEFVGVPYPHILYRVSTNSISSNVVVLEQAVLTVIERVFSQTPASWYYLKKYSLGNMYKYLLFKAFDGYPNRQTGQAAIRFLWQTLKYDPSMLRVRVTWKVLFNIMITNLLPTQQAQKLRQKMKGTSNVSALLAHLRFNFPELIQK